MADKDIKIIIETLLKSDKFKKGVAAMNTTAQKSSVIMSGFKKILAGLSIAFVATKIIAGFKAVIKVGIEFEQAIANVASVSGGARKELAKLAREAGMNTVFSARQSADALYYLASAGLDVKDMAKVLTPTLNFAAAAQIDIAKATDMVVGQLKVFKAKMSDAEKFTDIMAKTVASANTDMNQLGDALSYSSSIASTLGISFEDLNAVIATMADRGIKGARAGTQLRMALTRLIKPTSQAQEVLTKYGITQEEINNLLPTPIELFKRLKPIMDDAADATTIFGVRQQDVIGIIKSGLPKLDDLRKKIGNAGGAAQRMADIQLDTLSSQLKLLNSAWEEASIAMAEKFTPALRTGIEFITKLIKPEKTLDVVTKELIKNSAEYAKITKTLADESANLTKKERAKLQIRKAELKLDIMKNLKQTNTLYKEQISILPIMAKRIKTLKRIRIENAANVEKYTKNIDELNKKEHLNTKQKQELARQVRNLDRSMYGLNQRGTEQAKLELELAVRTGQYNEALTAMAIGLKSGLISKIDLIGVDEELIAKATELSKTINIETDATNKNADANEEAAKKKKTLADETSNFIIDRMNVELEELKSLYDQGIIDHKLYMAKKKGIQAKYGAEIVGMVADYAKQAFDIASQFMDAARDRQAIRHEEELAALDARYQAELDKAGGINEQLAALDDIAREKRLADLQTELDAAILAGDTELAAEKANAIKSITLNAEKDALLEEQAKEKAELEKQHRIESAKKVRAAAIMEKAAALFSIAASTAIGIMGIWGAPPYGPWAISGKTARTALVGSIGLAQGIAAVAKPLPEIPSYQSGTERTKEGSAYLHDDERVLTKAQNISGVSNQAYANAAMQGLGFGRGDTYNQNTSSNNQKYITISGITIQSSNAQDMMSQLEELAENTNSRILSR